MPTLRDIDSIPCRTTSHGQASTFQTISHRQTDTTVRRPMTVIQTVIMMLFGCVMSTSAVLALDVVESTDFPGSAGFGPGSVSVGIVDPGANSVSGTLAGQCVPGDCNGAFGGDSQDSFLLTVPAGAAIKTLTVSTGQVISPPQFSARFSMRRQDADLLYFTAMNNGTTENLAAIPIGPGVYSLTVYGGSAAQAGPYSLGWQISIGLEDAVVPDDPDAALIELVPGVYGAETPGASYASAGFIDAVPLAQATRPFNVRDVQNANAIVATGSVEQFILRATDGRLGFFYRVFNNATSSVPLTYLRIGSFGADRQLHAGYMSDNILPGDVSPSLVYRHDGVSASSMNFQIAIPPGGRSVVMLVKTDTTAFLPTGMYDVTTGPYQLSELWSSFGPAHPAALASLSHSGPTPLSPAFEPDVTDYRMFVATETTSITFSPLTASPTAVIAINGQAVVNGATSQSLPLNTGSNPIRILITSADGVSKREYTVDVIRRSPAPVALSLKIRRLAGESTTQGGNSRTYRFTATSVGQQAVGNVELSIPVPAGLTDVQWICEAPAGCSPLQGENAAAVIVTLGFDQSAHIDLTGDVIPGAAFIDLSAISVAPASGVTDENSISDPANGIGVFKSGFER